MFVDGIFLFVCFFSFNFLICWILFQEREAFIAKNKAKDSDTVSADKMSEFYKYFLDKNWDLHFYYNVSWYMKNLELLVLSAQVNVSKIYRKIVRKWFFHRKIKSVVYEDAVSHFYC